MSNTYRNAQSFLVIGLILVSSIGLTACGKSNDPPKEYVKDLFTRFAGKGVTSVKSVDNIQCKATTETNTKYLCVADVSTINPANGNTATTRYTIPLQRNGNAWFATGLPTPNGQ